MLIKDILICSTFHSSQSKSLYGLLDIEKRCSGNTPNWVTRIIICQFNYLNRFWLIISPPLALFFWLSILCTRKLLAQSGKKAPGTNCNFPDVCFQQHFKENQFLWLKGFMTSLVLCKIKWLPLDSLLNIYFWSLFQSTVYLNYYNYFTNDPHWWSFKEVPILKNIWEDLRSWVLYLYTLPPCVNETLTFCITYLQSWMKEKKESNTCQWKFSSIAIKLVVFPPLARLAVQGSS